MEENVKPKMAPSRRVAASYETKGWRESAPLQGRLLNLRVHFHFKCADTAQHPPVSLFTRGSFAPLLFPSAPIDTLSLSFRRLGEGNAIRRSENASRFEETSFPDGFLDGCAISPFYSCHLNGLCNAISRDGYFCPQQSSKSKW